MSTEPTQIQFDAVAPLTHIFLSLDLLEASSISDDNRPYLAIIRQNTERLQLLLNQQMSELHSLKLDPV